MKNVYFSNVSVRNSRMKTLNLTIESSLGRKKGSGPRDSLSNTNNVCCGLRSCFRIAPRSVSWGNAMALTLMAILPAPVFAQNANDGFDPNVNGARRAGSGGSE